MSKNPLSEKAIENSILNYLKILGIFAWKNNVVGIWDNTKRIYRKNNSPYAARGSSDIIGILPDGTFFAIEVKARYGKPSQEQTQFINNVIKNRGLALVAKSLSDVQRFLEENGYATRVINT